MSAPNLNKVSDNRYAVVGELNMQTVPGIARQASAFLNGPHGEVTIDLSGVTRADSAGLALLLDWSRVARRQQYTLRFTNLPEQLMQIAKVSELDEILPVSHG